MSLSTAKQLALDTYRAYSDDKAERLSAALAYYATFSLAPLLVLVLAVAGLLYGQRSTAAQEALITQVETVLGTDGAVLLEGVLEGAAASPTAGVWATVLSGLVLLIGATTLVARLQEALNHIWDASPASPGVLGIVWSRGLALLLVLGGGGVVVASLVLSSLLTGWADRLAVPFLAHAAGHLSSLVLLTGVAAVLYRTLPDAPVRWGDVWGGAVLAAVLLTLGSGAVGWYLGHAAVTSSYGAAGALVAFLLWTYYSAQFFLLGAELAHVQYARTAPAPSTPETAPAPPPLPTRAPSPGAPTGPPPVGRAAVGVPLTRLFRRDS
jgi:membrane protein